MLLKTEMSEPSPGIDWLTGPDITCLECARSFVVSRTRGGFLRHLTLAHGLSPSAYHVKHLGPVPTCMCGCGITTRWRSSTSRFESYRLGHSHTGKTKNNCEYRRRAADSIKKTLAATPVEVRRERGARSFATTFSMGKWDCPANRMTPEQLSAKNRKSMQTRIDRGTAPEGFKRMHRGWYLSSKSGRSFYHSSGWELELMMALDTHHSVTAWERPTWCIEYTDTRTGTQHGYYPDITVWTADCTIPVVIEVKGMRVSKDTDKIAAASTLLDAFGACFAVVTRGNDGFYVQERNVMAQSNETVIRSLLRQEERNDNRT